MSPRTPSQNQALRDATRARILDAALRVFCEYGYAGASVRRIADEAGMAPGLLYSHFEGKLEVLRAIYERAMDDVRESFRAAAGGGEASSEEGGLRKGGKPGGRGTPEPDSPLARLIRSAFVILRGNLAFWKLSYGVRMQEAVLRDLGPDIEAWSGQIRATLEAHFRAAGASDPKAEAAILFASIDGISQHFALDPARYPLDDIAEALIAKYAGPGRPEPHPHPRRKAGPHGPETRPSGPRRSRRP